MKTGVHKTVSEDVKAGAHSAHKDAAAIHKVSHDAKTVAHKDVPDVKVAAHAAGSESKKK